MIENIRLSFQGIWSHKLRSLLTMLGIIIGIAAIIAIVSAIKGSNERLKEKLIGQGNNMVKISLNQDDWELTFDDYTSVPDNVPVINDTMMTAIRALDDVEYASSYNYRQESSLSYGNKTTSGGVYGIDSDYLTTCGYMLQSGRLFTDNDLKLYRNVCLINDTMASNLFGSSDPVGEIVEIKGIPLTIVGVITEKESYEPIIESIDDYYTYYSSHTGNSSMLLIPKTIWPNFYMYDEPMNVVITSTSTDTMSSAGKAVADYLNQFITTGSGSSTYKYVSEDLLQELQNEQELANETNSMLVWIASISLLVGGIGVMNIMLVSVTERTREIGLKKAIGAPKSRIRTQFLTEAVALTSLGGIIGVAAGIGLAQAISQMRGTPFAISYPAIAIAVAFSMLIGIVFGLFPAVKASNLNPIDALRYE